jgi:hypothetical protein
LEAGIFGDRQRMLPNGYEVGVWLTWSNFDKLNVGRRQYRSNMSSYMYHI